MMKRFYLVSLILFTLVSCTPSHQRDGKEFNAVYYWKTVFELNDAEKDFLTNNSISRIYLRFFDIAIRQDVEMTKYEIVPIATTRFQDEVPSDIEVVPTCYLTLEALKEMKGEEALYADKIVTRILAMASYNKILTINEIQVDCDWTESTFPSYERLCHHLKERLQKEGLDLSITVRLHQLKANEWPEADRGVLMLYNTGGFKSYKCDNSILSYKDAKPYMKHLPKVSLPLDYAYPAFSWSLLFREKDFKCIISSTDYSDESLFERVGDNRFSVRKDTLYKGLDMRSGDVIRVEYSDPEQIKMVQEHLSELIGRRKSGRILYHLDSLQLSKFTDNEISQIYTVD